MKKILILGGGGYVGTVLTNKLLSLNYNVKIIDTFWFGNFLKEHANLKVISKDFRDLEIKDYEGYDSIIHLANIANDPTVELAPNLSWEINVLGSYNVMEKAIKAGIKQIIFASSGSVYGVQPPNSEVYETNELIPISIYNKTKMIAERVLLSYSDKMKIHIIRPATICGYSPRMRLDLTVNLLTFQALEKKEVTVLGGSQTRPNIHIDDMVNLYNFFLLNSEKISNGPYNAGLENLSIIEIANIIANKTNAKICIKESNDPRSYRQNSSKLINAGFEFKKDVATAIDELISLYNKGVLIKKDEFYNIKVMKKIYE